MNKEEMVIELCRMIAKLSDDIDKDKEFNNMSTYGLIGVRKELIDIVSSSKEKEVVVL